jgi:hypothetical protein
MSKRETQISLADIAYDAEQILRYFVKRDSMNAELHLEDHEKGLNVRLSPITVAAERVLGALWKEAWGDDSEPPTIRSIGIFNV